MKESFEHLPRMSMGEVNMASAAGRPLRVWLLSASSYQGVTLYRLAGRFSASGQTWEIHRRYSEFLTLRDKLIKFLSAAPDTCPGCRNYLHALSVFPFPKKHLLVSRTAPVVNYRVKALRAFVNLLASWTFSDSPKCPTCGGYAFDIVRNFLVDAATPASGSDMDFIRESMVVDTFSSRGERASGLTRRHSWIPAAASTTLQGQQQPHVRLTQSQRGRPSQSQLQSQSQSQSQSQRGSVPRQQSAPTRERMSMGQSQPQLQSHVQAQSRRGSMPGQPQSRRGSMPARESVGRYAPAAAPRADARTNAMNDAAYDVFNDYLPERPAHAKKAARKNTDEAADTTKFSARSLAEEARQRRQQADAAASARPAQPPAQPASRASSSASGQVRMYAEQAREGSHRGSAASQQRPAANQRPKLAFDSFYSESSASSVGAGAEPVFVHGDELRRLGYASSDTEEEEIDVTGVKLASPPRPARRKASSGENLWQPWELAKAG